MKRILPFLLALVSLPSFAQLELTSVFDFTKPESLSPSITPIKSTNGYVGVFNTTFTSGNVSLSFSTDQQSGGSAAVHTKLWLAEEQTGYYCLQIKQGTIITFKAPAGASIKSISFDDLSVMGGLSLRSGQAGTLAGKQWTCGNSSVSSVAFNNYSTESRLNTITVEYVTPQNTLTATPSLPNETASNQTASFTHMQFSFSTSVTAVSTSGITISGTGISGTKSLEVSVSGRYVTLSLPSGEVFNTDGDYTITVPAGKFRNAQGYMNKELSYSFKVRESRTTMVPEISPASGSSLTEIPALITLTFDQPVALANTSLSLKVDNVFYKSLTMNISANDDKVVEIPLGTNDKFGTYTISVDEGKIHNTAYKSTDTSEKELYDRWNPQFTIRYTITDPLKDQKDEVANLIRVAKVLYGQIGANVGYPAQDDATYSLAAVKDMEIPTTAQDLATAKDNLNAAIAAFYAQTNVVMPTVDKWYNVVGINSNNKKIYVTYANGKTGLSNSSAQAAAFQLSKNGDDTYNFMTADGKYLMVLSEAGNVANAVGKASQLTLSKLLVDGVDNDKLLGKFSISGWLGRDANDADLGNSTAAIDYTSTQVVATPTTELFFNATQSSAFTFEETTDPTYVEPVTPTASLSPTSVTLGVTTTATLTINGVTTVLLKDASKAYFSTDAAGQSKVSTTGSILTKTGGNTFTVSLAGLAVGTYYLQVPVGTFEYGQNTDPVNDVAFKQSITIVEPVSYFNTTYTLYGCPQVDESHGDPVKDEFLNGLVITASVPGFYSDLVPDPSKVVKIVNSYSLKVVGRGHFEAYPNFARDYPTYAADGYKGIIMVMDEPILPGALEDAPDSYSYQFPEAVFGDANFGKYLRGVAGIKKSDCVVNPAKTFPTFYVNNKMATTINGISADVEQGEQRVYDLNGRRVAEPVKGGIYIINGRKVLVK